MKREKITRNLEMIDATGIVRHVTATIEQEPGIRINAGLEGYYDEDGLYRKFVGRPVDVRSDLERIDLSKMENVRA